MNVKDIIPLDGRVIIEIKNEVNKSAGGIIIHAKPSEKVRTQFGFVVNVAKDVDDIKEGDEVIYDKYSGAVIAIPNDDNAFESIEYLVTRKEDILAVVGRSRK